MNKKQVLCSLLLVTGLLAGGCSLFSNTKQNQNMNTITLTSDEIFAEGPFIKVTLLSAQAGQEPKKIVVKAKVADTPKEREIGLMSVTKFPKDVGMFFIFQKPEIQNFWMKNTLIPLDMIFVDEKMKIVNIVKNVPPCRNDSCTSYKSSSPVLYVLEVNAGQSDVWGLKAGDSLQFDLKAAK